MIEKWDPPLNDSITVLREWWERRRGDRPMPRRSELDPAEIREILPDLVIVEVAAGAGPETLLLTYRLAGTRIDTHIGFNIKGMMVDAEGFGLASASMRVQDERAIVERRSVLATYMSCFAGVRDVEYERLVAPLSDETDARVVALVGVFSFKCVRSVIEGRPLFCPSPIGCGNVSLCVSRFREG
jgi:hypothetical protein